MTVSLLKGGGRHEDIYATQDDYETVVAWYDTHYGPCRVADAAQATWQGPGWADMMTQVSVLPMTPEWLPRLARLEASVQPLQRTIIRVTNVSPPRRRRWFGW